MIRVVERNRKCVRPQKLPPQLSGTEKPAHLMFRASDNKVIERFCAEYTNPQKYLTAPYFVTFERIKLN